RTLTPTLQAKVQAAKIAAELAKLTAATGIAGSLRHQGHRQRPQLRRSGVQERLSRRERQLDVVPFLTGLLHYAGEILDAYLFVLALAGAEAILRPPVHRVHQVVEPNLAGCGIRLIDDDNRITLAVAPPGQPFAPLPF